jgi:hypothetical protein
MNNLPFQEKKKPSPSGLGTPRGEVVQELSAKTRATHSITG